MGVSSFDGLLQHLGHSVVVATYGNPPVNVAVECLDCSEVLLDFDKTNSESREVWGTTWCWDDVVSQLDDMKDVFTALGVAIGKHLEAGIINDWDIAVKEAIAVSGLREEIEAINLETKVPR